MSLEEFEQRWLKPEQREGIERRIRGLEFGESLDIPLRQSTPEQVLLREIRDNIEWLRHQQTLNPENPDLEQSRQQLAEGILGMQRDVSQLRELRQAQEMLDFIENYKQGQQPENFEHMWQQKLARDILEVRGKAIQQRQQRESSFNGEKEEESLQGPPNRTGSNLGGESESPLNAFMSGDRNMPPSLAQPRGRLWRHDLSDVQTRESVAPLDRIDGSQPRGVARKPAPGSIRESAPQGAGDTGLSLAGALDNAPKNPGGPLDVNSGNDEDEVNSHRSDLPASSDHFQVSSSSQQLQRERTRSNLYGENELSLSALERYVPPSLPLGQRVGSWKDSLSNIEESRDDASKG
jgi:hypothetical protein